MNPSGAQESGIRKIELLGTDSPFQFFRPLADSIETNKSTGPIEEFIWLRVDLFKSHGVQIDRSPLKIRLKLDEPLRFAEIAAPPWRSLSRRKAQKPEAYK